MIPVWWSILLAAVGLTGLWLAGNHREIGWRIGIAVQAPWIAYAIVTRQWGFIVLAIGYGFVNARNLARWQGERRAAEREP